MRLQEQEEKKTETAWREKTNLSEMDLEREKVSAEEQMERVKERQRRRHTEKVFVGTQALQMLLCYSSLCVCCCQSTPGDLIQSFRPADLPSLHTHTQKNSNTNYI